MHDFHCASHHGLDCDCHIAGHSLGGALATLCAFDIAAAVKEAGAVFVTITVTVTTIVTIPVTAIAGHSLGGALATLCAFDIAAAVKEAGAVAESGRAIDVCCYTFGAPRTGNRAFRNDFNELVPNCWGIINDQVWEHPGFGV